MKRALSLFFLVLLMVHARADSRPGTIEFSDGHKISGALSLSPGKDLRLLNATKPVSLSLAEVKEMRFKAEKEEMTEGFYFPTAGQATQAKTGEIYPVRYISTELTLADGKVVAGHLATTTLYIESGDTTQKVVLLAKQTGANGQKLADVVYPTIVRFDVVAADSGSTRIDLSSAGFVLNNPPVIIVRPELSSPPVTQVEGQQAWTVPAAHPEKVLFCAEATDGIHVAWPATEADPALAQSVKDGLVAMHDFYDTRELLGCFSDGDDVYSLVMLKRVGTTYGEDGHKPQWSLVVLRWNYDADQKKVVLLNRALLVFGHEKDNSDPPPVLKQAELLRAISAVPQP